MNNYSEKFHPTNADGKKYIADEKKLCFLQGFHQYKCFVLSTSIDVSVSRNNGPLLISKG